MYMIYVYICICIPLATGNVYSTLITICVYLGHLSLPAAWAICVGALLLGTLPSILFYPYDKAPLLTVTLGSGTPFFSFFFFPFLLFNDEAVEDAAADGSCGTHNSSSITSCNLFNCSCLNDDAMASMRVCSGASTMSRSG